MRKTLWAVVMVACGGSTETHWEEPSKETFELCYGHLDTSFRIQEVQAICQAQAKWGEIVKPGFTELAFRPFTILKEDPGEGYRGYTVAPTHTIRIQPSIPDQEFYPTILHEYGHALGLDHVPDGVMNPSGVDVEFSEEDLQECRRVGSCEHREDDL